MRPGQRFPAKKRIKNQSSPSIFYSCGDFFSKFETKTKNKLSDSDFQASLSRVDGPCIQSCRGLGVATVPGRRFGEKTTGA
jgi:hypothetical protein